MLSTANICLSYGKRVIFKDVTLKFTPGNCYGLIGANGAGKSTFLKILAGELEADSGEVVVGARQRIAMLRQDQSAFDEHTVLDTVIMGHARLHALRAERDAIYARPELSEEDGNRVGELEAEFGELGGYEAESEASVLLSGLGIPAELGDRTMKSLEGADKVRVLLAQALFNNPDILLLDEPTT
jgi:ATPase subunit of ABC transporter with duplicated ATPase domains